MQPWVRTTLETGQRWFGRKGGIAAERKNSALPVQPVSLVVLMRSHVGERLEGDLDKGRRVVAVGWGGQCPGQQQAEAWQWWPPGTCQPAIKVPNTWASATLNLRWLMELSTPQYSDFSLKILGFQLQCRTFEQDSVQY